jgi:outer membrane protein assembly factor BamB
MDRRLRLAAAGLIAALACASAAAAAPALVVTSDPHSQPESVTIAPDGALILGSASKPAIYRAARGATRAEVFIDASSEGAVTFLGVLADAGTNTLWACQIMAVPNSRNRHTTLRGFDLATGVAKFRWALPGDTNLCNDFTVGPDGALYISDTLGSRIYRLKPGAQAPELLIEDRTLDGVDGLTFLDGVLYANNVISNNLYRIPLDASGKAGAPVQIWPDRPIKGPDGMRAAHGKLFLAENRNGRASMLTIHGDQAAVVTVLDGLTTPTAIEPAGDTLWVGDRATDQAVAIPLPK